MIVPPLKLYLIWHPGFTGSEDLPGPPALEKTDGKSMTNIKELADDIIRLFQGSSKEQLEGRQGIDVELRNEPVEGKLLPKDISDDDADLSILVLFIDDRMMRDENWSNWIEGLNRNNSFFVQPVWLLDVVGWANLTRQAIRLNECNKSERRVRCIRGLLILLSSQLVGGDVFPTIFVSYATVTPHPEDEAPNQRLDAKRIAELINEKLGDISGLECFVAHKSIPPGAEPEQKIDTALRNALAVVTVLTSNYHLRGECRKEIRDARQPQSLDSSKQCWHIKPVILVDALNHSEWSIVIQEFSESQIIRWKAVGSEAPVDELINRALIAGVISAYAQKLALKLSADDRVVITWVPDPYSMVELRALGGLTENCTVTFPGELDDSDRERLECAFGIKLLSFEEVIYQ